jgi:hypothetical protein
VAEPARIGSKVSIATNEAAAPRVPQPHTVCDAPCTASIAVLKDINSRNVWSAAKRQAVARACAVHGVSAIAVGTSNGQNFNPDAMGDAARQMHRSAEC